MHGDVSALTPGGVRVGAAALTSRSFKEEHFVQVAKFLHEAAQLAIEIQEKSASKLLKDFTVAAEAHPGVAALKEKVEKFSRSFPMPGFEPSDIDL